MRKLLNLFVMMGVFGITFVSCENELNPLVENIWEQQEAVAIEIEEEEPISAEQLYEDIGLAEVVNYQAFEEAVAGFEQIEDKKKDVLTIIDFSLPSDEERLYVIDLEQKELLYKTHVLHGRNSGVKYATSFSNQVNSYKSSQGFFLTNETYHGKYGYSLRIDGLESGINDKVRERAVVFHSSKYADPARIKTAGRLGRSLGCPALPPQMSKPVIDAIRDGSVVYVFAENEDYREKSDFFNESMNHGGGKKEFS
ncbi:MAG: murein L,D-transpeptidase catalytic domain family protein [Bacteroides sp.]|nr:murein L,D-transpeptidase catalytic domain family protein [Bacteroides sp.]